jgi:PAS domain S-box-containing protein
VNRLTRQFLVLCAVVTLAVIALRLNLARTEVAALEAGLLASADGVALEAQRRLGAAGDAEGGAVLEALRRLDSRVLGLQLLRADGQPEVAVVDAAHPPRAPWPPFVAEPGPGWREVAGFGKPPPQYVHERRLTDGRVLRLAFDATAAQQAWRRNLLTAVGVVLVTVVVMLITYRLLLWLPLRRLRETTAFAARMPFEPDARLPDGRSGLREIDDLRAALNAAADVLATQQRALDEQRALLRNVIDRMAGGLVVKTLQGQLLVVNDYISRRLGHRPGSLELHPEQDVGDPVIVAQMRAMDERLLEHARDDATEVAEVMLGGEPHLVTKALMQLPGRAEPLIVTTSANLGALRRTEAAIEEAGRLLRAVFDADDALMMLKDGEGRFVMVNSAFLAAWGLEAERVIGRSSQEVFGDVPGVRESLDLDRRVWQGEDVGEVAQRIEIGGRVRDFTVSRRRVSEPGGRRLLLVVSRDVTALQEQSRAFERQVRLTREVIDLEEHYVFVKDDAMRYVLVNQAYARRVGRTPESMIGRTPHEVFGADPQLEELLAADRRVLAGGAELVREVVVDFGDGPRRLLEHKRRLELADGRPGVLAIVRDVTDDRAQEAALREAVARAEAAVQARNRFLANISHEIRTPINGILGLTELVLGGHLAPRQREWLQLSQASAENLLSIVNDVLDLSKIDAGAMAIERTRFDLHALVVECCRPLALRAATKGLAFGLAIDPGVPETVQGDPMRLRQVLSNLIGNAIKFTTAGEVRVHVAVEAQGRVALAVRDTGPGVPPDQQARIFEPFAQGDDSTTRRFGGTGLGLAICRELVTLMGGRMHLDSTPGVGSCFSFALPLPEADAAPWPALAGARVAWVGESAADGAIWQPWFGHWGASVTCAHTREQALAMAAGSAEVLVLDRVADARLFRDAIREWRGHGLLRHVVLIADPSGGGEIGGRIARRLPGLRGLPLQRLTHPFSPRQLAEALQRGEAGVPVSRPALPPRNPLDGRHVLLAEDNEVNGLLAEAVLAKLGATSRTVRDGAEALAALRESPFDVVLMDIQMPELDGIEAIGRWRAEERERGATALPVIAMTAHAMAGDRERFLAAGFDGYVGKPFTQQSLLAEIERVAGAPRA